MELRCIRTGTCADLLGVVCMRVGRAEASYQKPVIMASDIPNLSIYDSQAAWWEVANVLLQCVLTQPHSITVPKYPSSDVDDSGVAREVLDLCIRRGTRISGVQLGAFKQGTNMNLGRVGSHLVLTGAHRIQMLESYSAL